MDVARSRPEAPTEAVGPSVWIYTRYRCDHQECTDADCTASIVTFADRRVARMFLVNDAARPAVLARLQNDPIYPQGAQIARK